MFLWGLVFCMHYVKSCTVPLITLCGHPTWEDLYGDEEEEQKNHHHLPRHTRSFLLHDSVNVCSTTLIHDATVSSDNTTTTGVLCTYI